MTLLDDLNPHARRLHRRMRPVTKGEEAHGYSVAALAAALSAPSDPLNDLIRAGEGHEAWEPAVDPEKALELGREWTLPWLASIVGAGGPAGPRLVEVQRNYVLNPSVEVDLAEVGVYNYANGTGTITRNVGTAPHGTCSVRVNTLAAGGELWEGVEYRAPGLAPGWYGGRVTIWRTGALPLEYYALGMPGTNGGVNPIAITEPISQWNEHVIPAFEVTTGGQFMVGVRKATIAQDDEFYVDKAFLTELAGPTDPIPEYFDGSFLSDGVFAHAWGGVANASHSTKSRLQTEEEWAAEIIEWILDRPRWRRGQPLYIRQQILKTLYPNATLSDVRIIPRSNGPWRDTIVISAAKTPNQAVTTAAAMAEKPAFREWTITYTNDYVINEMSRLINNVTATIDTAQLADVT